MSIPRPRSLRFVAMLAPAFVLACKDTAAPPPAAQQTALPDSADQMAFGMSFALTTGGVRRGNLHADTAYFYDQGNRVDLRTVNTVFFNSAGVKNATMVARQGLLDQRTQKLDGRGDVVVTSEDGRRLTSPHVIYDRSINQISSDTNFVFTQPRGTVSGIGFRSDPQLRNVTVLRNAGGRTVLEPAGTARTGRP